MEEFFKKITEKSYKEQERFINYCNKNYFPLRPLWKTLYFDSWRYSEFRQNIPIIITYTIFTTSILFTLSITLIDSIHFLIDKIKFINQEPSPLGKDPLYIGASIEIFFGVFPLLITVISLILTRKLILLKVNIHEKFKENTFYQVKRIIGYWTVILVAICAIAFLYLWSLVSPGNAWWIFIRFAVLFIPFGIFYSKGSLIEFYRNKIFPEYQEITYINCEYDDFIKGKLPNMNNPKIEINQILTTKLIAHPRNKEEKETIQFINSNNEGIVFSIVNSDLSDKLRSNPNNTLTAQIEKIHEFGKLKIKLSRNFLVKDEEL